MEMREANPRVNDARNNGPEMLERIDQMTQNGIFPLCVGIHLEQLARVSRAFG